MTVLTKGLVDAEALLTRYEEEPHHVRHVALLAGQLFDALQPWHQLGPEEGQLLHLAALLHDIGWSQTPGGEGHHKWSAKLIAVHGWKDLSDDEIRIIAQIARYHRKSIPSDKHEEFHMLSKKDRDLVCQLAGILRVADALDRTHTQIVRHVSANVKPAVIELLVEARGLWLPERQAVLKKCDLLEIASGRKVRIGEV